MNQLACQVNLYDFIKHISISYIFRNCKLRVFFPHRGRRLFSDESVKEDKSDGGNRLTGESAHRYLKCISRIVFDKSWPGWADKSELRNACNKVRILKAAGKKCLGSDVFVLHQGYQSCRPPLK